MSKTLYVSVYDDEIRITRKHSIKDINIECNGLFKGEVVSNGIVENFIDELKSVKIKAKKAVISMCTTGIIVHTDRLPKMKTKLLKRVIAQKVDEYLAAISIEDYEWHYTINDEVQDNGSSYYNISVIAVKRSQIERVMELMSKAGIKVLNIDVLPNVLHGMKYNMEVKNTMIIDGNLNGVHLMLVKDGSLATYITVPFRVEVNKDLQELESLYGEIKGYIDYYKSRNQGASVDNIIVLGTLGMMSDFISELKQRYQVNVVNNYTSESMFTTTIALEALDKKRQLNFVPIAILNKKYARQHRINTILYIVLFMAAALLAQQQLEQYNINRAKEVQGMEKQSNQLKKSIKEASKNDCDAQLAKLNQYKKLEEYDYDVTTALDNINMAVPSNIVITGIYMKHVEMESKQEEKDTTKIEQTVNVNKQINEVEAAVEPVSQVKKKEAIYEKIPNVVIIDGEATGNSDTIGIFVNKLTKIDSMSNVNLKSMTNAGNGKIDFTIEMKIAWRNN